MSPHPSTNFEETNVGIFGFLLDRVNVGRVQLLSVQEAGLLKNGNSFEPVEEFSQGFVRIYGVRSPEFIVDFRRNLQVLLTA